MDMHSLLLQACIRQLQDLTSCEYLLFAGLKNLNAHAHSFGPLLDVNLHADNRVV
ncbi:hypothetical protein SVAN01_03217 [Stagonosporopsis vannaccii]|nr:hypothetical protein SVAN01_03217 [Stagonosporopsis vannaccii]